MSEQLNDVVLKTIKQVDAILQEMDIAPRTGRTRPDIGKVLDDATITSLIDHTLLRPDATARDIEMLCLEAKQNGFASVCVNSWYVPLAREILQGSTVTVTTVIGFPLGLTLPQVKVYETQEAIKAGAREIDMVMSIGALKSRDLAGVFEDITDVAKVCHDHPDEVVCKVIIEAGLLTDTEKVIACQLAKRAGADFVKTSTSFNKSGATVADVALMRRVVGESMGVKASGGVISLAQARSLVEAGANRIGTHSSVKIARDERAESN
ncbi:MAG: deoxyribose-phosphate aldolase [Anaerolineae bacterium]